MLQKSCTDRSRLTVLHLVQPVEGGVARVVTDLVAAQVRAGLRPVVACPPDGPLAAGASTAGARVCAWPAERAPGPGLG
ncbi:glycosyl transferase family 1, partial [Streptomyces sp. FT05W]